MTFLAEFCDVCRYTVNSDLLFIFWVQNRYCFTLACIVTKCDRFSKNFHWHISW